MGRHPHRPKVGQNIGPPEEDGEGPQPRCSTRRPPPDEMDTDDGEVHHDGGHRNPPPQAKSDGEPPKMCMKGTDVPQSLVGSVSAPPGQFG